MFLANAQCIAVHFLYFIFTPRIVFLSYTAISCDNRNHIQRLGGNGTFMHDLQPPKHPFAVIHDTTISVAVTVLPHGYSMTMAIIDCVLIWSLLFSALESSVTSKCRVSLSVSRPVCSMQMFSEPLQLLSTLDYSACSRAPL